MHKHTNFSNHSSKENNEEYLTSLVIKKMQMNKSEIMLQISVAKQTLLSTVDQSRNWKIFLEENLTLCFQNFKRYVPFDLAIPQYGIYPREITRQLQNPR